MILDRYKVARRLPILAELSPTPTTPLSSMPSVYSSVPGRRAIGIGTRSFFGGKLGSPSVGIPGAPRPLSGLGACGLGATTPAPKPVVKPTPKPVTPTAAQIAAANAAAQQGSIAANEIQNEYAYAYANQDYSFTPSSSLVTAAGGSPVGTAVTGITGGISAWLSGSFQIGSISIPNIALLGILGAGLLFITGGRVSGRKR
jgi:hypothetical protein